MLTRTRPPALVALSPGDMTEANALDFARTARACAHAGLRGVVLREPRLSDRATLELALALRAILSEARSESWLCIHDRVHLAAACRADAVHVGWRSLAPAAARRTIADNVQLGFSAHAGDDPRQWEVCDYAFFGPVRATPSKSGLREPVGFEGLATAARSTTTPLWALGGITPDHVEHALASGAAGVAVLGGIARAADPAAACARYIAALRATER